MNNEGLSNLLFALSGSFNQKGIRYDIGANEERLKEHLVYARTIALGRDVRAIKYWQWWDIDSNVGEDDFWEINGCKPVIVKSELVVHADIEKQRIGRWVISTPLVEFVNPFYFCTRNTVYVLIGTGSRIEVPIEVALLFFGGKRQ